MKKITLFLSALVLSFALNAQVTVSNVTVNPNGTLTNSTDDAIEFDLMATPPSATYMAPFTYTVTATQGGSPVAVTLTNGSAATAPYYVGGVQRFKLANGSAGKGNVTVSVTPNFGSFPPQTANVTDPGAFYLSNCGSGSQTITYRYVSPRLVTEFEDAPALNIPKFNPAIGTLTGVSIAYSNKIWGRAMFESRSPLATQVYGKLESDNFFYLGSFLNGTGEQIATNNIVTWNVPASPTSGRINLAAAVSNPASGTWAGDNTTVSPPSTLKAMVDDASQWFKNGFSYGLDVTIDPRYVNNATNPTSAGNDDDIYISPEVMSSSNGTKTYSTTVDLAKFTGTGAVPLTYSTLSGYSLTGGGGNLIQSVSTFSQFVYEVTYTYTPSPCYTVSGTVFHDIDGATNGINNLSGVNTNLGLNAVLVDADGIVVDVVAVNPANGTFILGGAKGGSNYKVIITTNPATKGAAAPAVALPSNWVSTGEQNGGGTVNDGTANGQSASFTMPAANVTQRDFGIEQLPDTQDRSVTVGQPTGSAIPAGAITSNAISAVLGNDPDGSSGSNLVLGNSHTIVIKSLANNGVAYYNGTAITVGQVITGFDPTKLSYTGLAQGTTSTQFDYAFVDAAGKEDPTPAHYTVSWPNALPVVFGGISAVLSDNLLVINFVSEKEINNDHFEVEASTDGINFQTIGSIASKAKDGNSSSAISYEFTTSSSNLMGANMGWIGAVLGIALVLIAFTRRNKLVRVFTLVAVMSLLGATSCSKNGSDVNLTNEGKLWVRIAQVDKDGVKSYSKVITVVKK